MYSWMIYPIHWGPGWLVQYFMQPFLPFSEYACMAQTWISDVYIFRIHTDAYIHFVYIQMHAYNLIKSNMRLDQEIRKINSLAQQSC